VEQSPKPGGNTKFMTQNDRNEGRSEKTDDPGWKRKARKDKQRKKEREVKGYSFSTAPSRPGKKGACREKLEPGQQGKGKKI